MRWLLLLLLLPACSTEEVSDKRLYAGSGKDRLCIDGDRVGFIVHAAGGANCSVRGRLDQTGAAVAIIPAGDQECRIAAERLGDRFRLGPLTRACAYYCGPGADFSGQVFEAAPGASPAVDFAGDPLC